MAIDNALLAGYGTVKEVAGINLHARLTGIFLKHDSGLRAIDLGGENGVVALGVKDPVVVEAVAVADLLIVRVDVIPDKLHLPEIKRSALHGSDLACGHERRIHRSIVGSVDVQRVSRNLMVRRITRQIEVRMIGHVDDRRSVRRGGVPDVYRIALGKGESHVSGHLAREVRVPVRRDNLQFQVRGIGLKNIVNLVLPPVRTSMQTMPVVVLRQLILNSVQSESTAVDAVGVTTDGGTEISLVVLREIVGNLVEAKDNILVVPVPVRYHH